MLRDVKHNVSDGLMGFGSVTIENVHIKVGVSPIVSTTPIIVTGDMNAAKIKSRLGLSPLADAVMDAVQFGATRIFCIPIAATTEGTIGDITHDGDGIGSIAVAGSPTNAFGVIVKITGQGGLNTAAFTVSIDDGYSFSDEITVPLTGSYEIAGTGLTLTFTEAEEEDQKANSFVVDEIYTFKTTAPVATNGDILTAVEKIKNFNQEFEFIHIVGESTLPLWQAMSELQSELMADYKKPAFILLEAAYPTEDEEGSLENWAFQMEADRKKIKNTDIQVCAAWGLLVRLDGTTQTVNLAGAASGRYAITSVQKSIGQTRPEAGMGFPKAKLLELVPSGYDRTIIDRLDVAGYMTFREYDGLEDIFVYHTKMMSPEGSDYRYAEDIRVRNKIIRETRKEALLLKNDDIDMENIQAELDTRAKFISAPLDTMVENKEISSYEVTVVSGHEESFFEDETLRLQIRYVSRGYIREIEIDLGRAGLND